MRTVGPRNSRAGGTQRGPARQRRGGGQNGNPASESKIDLLHGEELRWRISALIQPSQKVQQQIQLTITDGPKVIDRVERGVQGCPRYLFNRSQLAGISHIEAIGVGERGRHSLYVHIGREGHIKLN